jgi:hypothetical protein
MDKQITEAPKEKNSETIARQVQDLLIDGPHSKQVEARGSAAHKMLCDVDKNQRQEVTFALATAPNAELLYDQNDRSLKAMKNPVIGAG